MIDLNASPETVQAVVKTLQLAAILDDRCANPDKARAAAWSEQVERHKLAESDLLDGLQAFYDSPSSHAIQIGDLIQHARACRRDRNEREPAAILEQRAQAHDAKAADALDTIGAGAFGGPIPAARRTTRLESAEIALQVCFGKAESQAAIAEYFAARTAPKGFRR